MAAPPNDGRPYKMPEYPPGGPYPCSAPPQPRFLGPPLRAPDVDEVQSEDSTEIPLDPNGPAVCGLSQLDAATIAVCELESPLEPSPPVIAPGPPQIFRCGTKVPGQEDFLPLGAGGPAPPVENVTPHRMCNKGPQHLGAGGCGNKMPPTAANPENAPAP